jgi:hypothetical protein
LIIDIPTVAVSSGSRDPARVIPEKTGISPEVATLKNIKHINKSKLR